MTWNYGKIYMSTVSHKLALIRFPNLKPYMIPIPINESEGSENLDYIFEPSLESIANTLIPKSLKIQFYKSLLDSHASEHGARMTAMHKATDNAQELKDELTLTYNRQRQAAITNEILEIVGGAEALNDG